MADVSQEQPGHRLRPLLAPRSIACVGASGREGSPGNNIVKMVALGGYEGEVYPVNPGYETVEGLACWPELGVLPQVPDLAVLALADQRLEQALIDAIEAGVRSAVIFGGANLVEDTTYRLPARLRDLALEAELPICGGNGMGFYNLDEGLYLTFAYPPYKTQLGGATLISHSGSSWSALTLNDGRLGFNLAVSSGQELTVGVAEYLDYAVEQPSTTVVGLILETVREPVAFRQALEKANRRRIPVVALKVGRTEKSAVLAISHSGAIAGDDAAYEALFDYYGVSRADTLEELGASLTLLSQAPTAPAGGLACIHDSGFERELFIDLAEDRGVAYSNISSETVQRLSELLDPGLEPVNPLDAWGTGHDYQHVFTECLVALMEDPDTALGFISHNSRDHAAISESWTEVTLAVRVRHQKPMALVTGLPWINKSRIVQRLTAEGIPVIEGMGNALVAARHLFEQRDFCSHDQSAQQTRVNAGTVAKWRERLGNGDPLDEVDGLSLLADFGIPVVRALRAYTLDEVREAAAQLSGPTVLKTAVEGIHHKTEVGGVHLNLRSSDALEHAYCDLASRLGPAVTLAQMAGEGVEMSLGLIRDSQFGPLVMIGAGGVLIEVVRDRVLALPPFDRCYAAGLIDGLKSRVLLDGHRGGSGADVTAFAAAAEGMANIALTLGDLISELDANPIIVSKDGVCAVDALVIQVE